MLLPIGLLGTGCWPMRFTTSPGVTGVVLHGRTQKPVTGAEVFMSRAAFRVPSTTNSVTDEVGPVALRKDQVLSPSLEEATAKARVPKVVTGPDGRFSIPPLKEWGVYIALMDPMPPHGTLVVRRDGYAEVIQLVYGQSNVIAVGKIELQVVPE